MHLWLNRPYSASCFARAIDFWIAVLRSSGVWLKIARFSVSGQPLSLPFFPSLSSSRAAPRNCRQHLVLASLPARMLSAGLGGIWAWLGQTEGQIEKEREASTNVDAISRQPRTVELSKSPINSKTRKKNILFFHVALWWLWQKHLFH